MSKIDDLIQEFCPDGVEYKPIKKLAEVGTGSSNGNEAQEDGKYPFFIRSQTVKRKNEWEYDEEAIIIPGEGGIGEIYHYVNGKYAIHQRVYRIHFTDNSVDVKFAYHYFRAFFKNFIMRKAVSATVKSIRKPMIEEFMLPVPPLEVQREIVHILDSFTLLTAELTAELTARKKQYEFYRNKMLTFDSQEGKASEITWRTLAEIADISTGSSNTDDAIEDGVYPFYVRSQEPLKKNDYEYDEEAIITAGDGVGVGKVFHYVNGKYALHQRAYRIHPVSTKLSGRYLYHYFITKFPSYIGKQMYQGSVPSIRRPMLNSFEIAIPALEIQKKIVAVLDNFDTICTDLNIGLPAEIEARQKQYEYYRDLLLTFAEKGNTVLTDGRTDGPIDR